MRVLLCCWDVNQLPGGQDAGSGEGTDGKSLLSPERALPCGIQGKRLELRISGAE